MSNGITVSAPCKINIHLHIQERRSDGFHNLESVFLALSCTDLIHLQSLKSRSTCDLQMSGSVPIEQNTVYKAFQAFKRATGYNEGVQIRVEKRIPSGAGLGGASSDAAATLLALNTFSGVNLNRAALSTIANTVGSDVPFFMGNGCSWVSGKGECVEDLTHNLEFYVVLVKPDFSCETPAAYKRLDSFREHEKGITQRSALGREAALVALTQSAADWPFWNDFQDMYLSDKGLHSSEIALILKSLKAHGAVFTSLSGSGSVCFGVFYGEKEAERAKNALSSIYPWVEVALPLALSGNTVLQ